MPSSYTHCSSVGLVAITFGLNAFAAVFAPTPTPSPTSRAVDYLGHGQIELLPTASPDSPIELFKRQSIISANTCGFIAGDASLFPTFPLLAIVTSQLWRLQLQRANITSLANFWAF